MGNHWRPNRFDSGRQDQDWGRNLGGSGGRRSIVSGRSNLWIAFCVKRTADLHRLRVLWIGNGLRIIGCCPDRRAGNLCRVTVVRRGRRGVDSLAGIDTRGLPKHRRKRVGQPIWHRWGNGKPTPVNRHVLRGRLEHLRQACLRHGRLRRRSGSSLCHDHWRRRHGRSGTQANLKGPRLAVSCIESDCERLRQRDGLNRFWAIVGQAALRNARNTGQFLPDWGGSFRRRGQRHSDLSITLHFGIRPVRHCATDIGPLRFGFGLGIRRRRRFGLGKHRRRGLGVFGQGDLIGRIRNGCGDATNWHVRRQLRRRCCTIDCGGPR